MGPILVLLKSLKKVVFGGTYFRDIYSGANNKIYKYSWKEFKELENIDKKYYSSDFYDVSLNKYGTECGTSLRFWESKGWINEIYGWLQWYFRYWKGRRSEDDQRQINRWKRIVSRFKGILIKMISKSGDSPKIRQVLLHWGYELKNQKKLKGFVIAKKNKYFINCTRKDAPKEIGITSNYVKYCLSHSVFCFFFNYYKNELLLLV